MWRMIDVCMGATPSGQAFPDGHNAHPSVTDVPNMEKLFGRIYDMLAPLGKKYALNNDLCVLTMLIQVSKRFRFVWRRQRVPFVSVNGWLMGGSHSFKGMKH